jgi:hypothetical protein
VIRYFIHWKDPTREPEIVWADGVVQADGHFTFHTTTDGKDETRVIARDEIEEVRVAPV